MGRYITNALTQDEYKLLISTIRNGYVTEDGHKHKPNNQVADIITLEANLGCRLGDIIKLTKDSFILDGGIWKLNIVEEKTKKKRTFIVPEKIKNFIDTIANPDRDELFTIQEAAVWKCLRQVTSYLGMDNVSSHSARKMAAQSLMEKSDHNVALVCQFLQHSSISTTTRYLRYSSKQMESALKDMVNIV